MVEAEQKVPILLVGSYHFSNPGLDLVKNDLDDHMSAKRQAEIREVVDRLAEFRPTKIMVEWPASDTGFDERYQQYRAGDYTLKVNEREQIGLRLAKMLGHEHIYPVDHRSGMDFDSMMQYGMSNGMEAEVAKFQETAQKVGDMQNAFYAKSTVQEILAMMNSELYIKANQGLYLDMLKFSGLDSQPGADVIGGWYTRNLRTLSTIRHLSKPGDRVMVLMGASHTAILNRFVKDSIFFELADPLEYLGTEPVDSVQ